MNLGMLFRSALRSLSHHKMRTLLTTLGIIIGIVSIIAVMSIGEGAKYKIKKEIEKMGANFIVILAAPQKTLSQQRGGVNMFTLTPSDYQTIKDECSDVHVISPAAMYSTKIVYGGTSWSTQVGGVNEDYPEIRQWKIQHGGFFSNQDVRSANKVIALGLRVAQELFGDENPIGATVRIKNMPFKVISVLPEMGRSPDGRDLDDMAFAPITTVLKKLLGKTNYNAIVMATADNTTMTATARQIRLILRQKHRIKETDDDDFTIFSQDDAFKATEAASLVMTLLLLIIASISLIVGGIGIMNIMLVTVTERTKEIGIRMALGATTQSILRQFILEAIMICLVGGLLGVLVGIGTAELVSFGLGWPIFISQKAIAISLCSATGIGLFFGYFPARKASRLDPVEALIEQ